MLRASIGASHSCCVASQSCSNVAVSLRHRARFFHPASASLHFKKLGDDRSFTDNGRNRLTGLHWYENSKEKEQKRKERDLQRKRQEKEQKQLARGRDQRLHRDRSQTANKVILASRLNNTYISPLESGPYSGFKDTPGTRPNQKTTPHPLSKSALRSKVVSAFSDDSTARLGQHASSVLFEPLLVPRLPQRSLLGVREAPGPELDEDRTPPISFDDFVCPNSTLNCGDFVEIRTPEVRVGIILPLPKDEQVSDKIATISDDQVKDLFVLLSNGEVGVASSSDIMFCIPNVVEPELCLAAAPLSREHIVPSTDIDARRNPHAEPATSQLEPVNVAIFEARASVCSIIRTIERQKERETQRLLPAFQSTFLVDPEQHSAEDEDLHNLEQHFPLDDDYQFSVDRTDRADLRTGSISTSDAAKLLYKVLIRDAVRDNRAPDSVAPVTAATIYACHVLLMERPFYFLVDDHTHRESQLFSCRPPEQRRKIETVIAWASAPPKSVEDGYIVNFGEKAKTIKAWREAHPYDDSGPPRIVEPPLSELNIEWTEQDKLIIEFLLSTVSTRREIQSNILGGVAMSIVKRADAQAVLLPYPVDKPIMTEEEALDLLFREQDRDSSLSKAVMRSLTFDAHAGPDQLHFFIERLLVDIGVMSEFQNITRLAPSFVNMVQLEDGSGLEPDVAVTDATEIVDRAPDPSIIRKYELSLDDLVEDTRTDFGPDMAVYAIDDPEAFELDDGVSIEPVTLPDRKAEQAWVHIHVADPTAFVQPGTPLDRRASHRFASFYFPEARWAMLPDDLLRSGVGLRPVKPTDNVAQRTMTFSALVDLSSGLVQDTKVRPGIVRNVQIVPYDRVSRYLLSFGSDDLSSKQKTDLSMLFKVADKLSENRARGAATMSGRMDSEIRVSPLSLPSTIRPGSLLDRPRFYAGHPTIMTQRQTLETPVPQVAQYMVAELMILSGRIAGTFGLQNKLSLPYRLQGFPESQTDTDFLLSKRINAPHPTQSVSLLDCLSSHNVLGHSTIDYAGIRAAGVKLKASVYSAIPGAHFSLGIPPSLADTGLDTPTYLPAQYHDALTKGGYVRSSSPLRRYPDMLSHWQIKNQLVHRRKVLGREEMEGLLPRILRQERLHRTRSTAVNRFWLHSLARYALKHHNDPALSEEQRSRLTSYLGPLKATVLLSNARISPETGKSSIRVLIEDLNFPAAMEWDFAERQLPVGEVVFVEIVYAVSAGQARNLVVRRVAT